ncbi:MAG: cupin domain-containing protein [Proteobacteria bacterium]|nr:cupin domain-containing protein [Pseudomonadota bacterium]
MTETIRMGAITLKFLRTKHDTGGGLDLFEMTLQPSGRMPVPHHHRNWDETVYGLAGTVTFTLDGVPHAIAPGETLFIPRGAVHGFDNRSGAEARCLCLLTPGVLGPEYFREMAAMIGSGPPDPEKMKAVMLRHGLVPAPPG